MIAGEVHVLDAYCPHLGANMAIGGVVRGNCLECPFHKWQFSGENGACTKVPYSSGSVPAAAVKKWICHEVNHFIFVWYHAEGDEPSWYIQSRKELEGGAWRFQGRTELLAACHIQVPFLSLYSMAPIRMTVRRYLTFLFPHSHAYIGVSYV